jgi:hypothetical protein
MWRMVLVLLLEQLLAGLDEKEMQFLSSRPADSRHFQMLKSRSLNLLEP